MSIFKGTILSQLENNIDFFVTDFLNKNRVLLTGSSGYIGSALSSYMSKHKNFIGIDKDAIVSDLIYEHQLNLNNKIELNSLIKDFDPNIIFHCGTNSALHYQNDFLNSFDEDWTSFKNIVNSGFSKTKRLVFFSSSYVYSGIKGENIDEEINPSPYHNFGNGKRFFEKQLLNTFPNSIIFRLSSVFGKGKPRSPNIIFNLINDGINNNKLTIWGNGVRQMQFVSLMDVLNILTISSTMPPGVYNLASNDYLETKQVGDIVSNKLNIPVKFLTNKVEGESLPFLNNNKIKSTLNLDFTDTKSAIINYINSFKKL
jgi:dTDP-4-dehydrorhamnose reductase